MSIPRENYIIASISLYRVEGKGKAVITDVIYSNKTTEEIQNPGSKEEYEALKVIVINIC